MRVRRGVALRAALLAVVAGFANQFPAVVTGAFLDWQGSGVPLPRLGTVGQTVTTYTLFAKFVAFLAVPVGAAALGYWAADRLELVAAYREYLATLLAAAGPGLFLGNLAAGALSLMPLWPAAIVASAVAAAALLVEFVLAAFAGTAYAEVRTVRLEAGEAGADD